FRNCEILEMSLNYKWRTEREECPHAVEETNSTNWWQVNRVTVTILVRIVSSDDTVQWCLQDCRVRRSHHNVSSHAEEICFSSVITCGSSCRTASPARKPFSRPLCDSPFAASVAGNHRLAEPTS